MRILPLSRPVVAGLSLLLAAITPSPAAHAITVDGTAEADYGAALAVQTNATGYGDSASGATDGTAQGSELDQAFGTVQSGMLYLTFAGNLESNFNQLSIFIDTGNGLGQNTLAGNNQSTLSAMNGLEFDTAFTPYYYFTLNGGGDASGVYHLYTNYATLPVGGSSAGGVDAYFGNTTVATNGTLAGGGGNNGVQLAFNNSNTAGVQGNSVAGAQTSGAGVTTGFELAIPLTFLGSPTGNIRVSAFVTNNAHDNLSNQFLGPLPANTGNLGPPSSTDLSIFDGDQFFTVLVPEPGSVTMLCAGAVALGGWAYRRRR